MNIKSLLKSALSAVAIAAAVAAPAYADVFQDFQVNTGTSTFTADKITGGYSEIFTVTSPTTFSTSAYANLTSFFANEGRKLVNVTTALYATFTATGNIVGDGTSFQGTTGTIKLYLDTAAAMTDLSLPSTGGAAIIRNNSDDDLLLASTSSFKFGSGHNFPGDATAANGDFSLTFNDFLLTKAGEAYFVSPTPFHMQFTIDGNFGTFTLPLVGSSNSDITGSTNVFFVPEPGMVALFGIALLGFGVSRRRRSAN